jgi:hypothetical protein
VDDLTLRLHTEVMTIEDLGAIGPKGADAPTTYQISVQLIGISGAAEDHRWGASHCATIHTEASRTADDTDVSNITERAVIALADLVGERMRADRG